MKKSNKAIRNFVGVAAAGLLALITYSCNKVSNLAGQVIKNEIPTEFIQKETGRIIPSKGGFPSIPKDFQTKNPYGISLSDFKRVAGSLKTPFKKIKRDINTYQIQQALTPPKLPEVSVRDNFSVSTLFNTNPTPTVLANPKVEELFLPHLSPFPANSSVKKVTHEWQPTQNLPRQGVETGTPVRGLW
jgi:hypothetical protein